MDRLQRVIVELPLFVQEELVAAGLLGAFRNRPDHQRNDYAAWIVDAKTEATQRRRIERMRCDLTQGLYRGVAYSPRSMRARG